MEGFQLPIGGVWLAIGGVQLSIGGVWLVIEGVQFSIGGVWLVIGGVQLSIGGIRLPPGCARVLRCMVPTRIWSVLALVVDMTTPPAQTVSVQVEGERRQVIVQGFFVQTLYGIEGDGILCNATVTNELEHEIEGRGFDGF